MQRVKLEQKRKKEASIQRFYAEKYKKAAEKAEKLERQRIGARVPKGTSTSAGEITTD
jgi:hypothetical protein